MPADATTANDAVGGGAAAAAAEDAAPTPAATAASPPPASGATAAVASDVAESAVLYAAVADYAPAADDEIVLHVNDLVSVLTVYEDESTVAAAAEPPAYAPPVEVVISEAAVSTAAAAASSSSTPMTTETSTMASSIPLPQLPELPTSPFLNVDLDLVLQQPSQLGTPAIVVVGDTDPPAPAPQPQQQPTDGGGADADGNSSLPNTSSAAGEGMAVPTDRRVVSASLMTLDGSGESGAPASSGPESADGGFGSESVAPEDSASVLLPRPQGRADGGGQSGGGGGAKEAKPSTAPLATAPMKRTAPLATDTAFRVQVVSRPGPLSVSPLGALGDDLESTPDGDGSAGSSRAEILRTMELRSERRRRRMPADASMIGTMTVMVAGDSGIGKTSLIEALSDLPIFLEREAPPPPAPSGPADTPPAASISTTRLSTIPAGQLRHGEERFNVLMVDTPGFGAEMDAAATVRRVVEWVLSQYRAADEAFERLERVPDVARFVSGGTGATSIADVCIYGVLHRLKPVDIEFMRQLAPLVNLVPVLLKSDTLEAHEIAALRASVLAEVVQARIPIYGFGLSPTQLLALVQGDADGPDGATLVPAHLPPFVLSSRPVGDSSTTREEDSGAAIPAFARAVLVEHAGELRVRAALRFAAWRAVRVDRQLAGTQHHPRSSGPQHPPPVVVDAAEAGAATLPAASPAAASPAAVVPPAAAATPAWGASSSAVPPPAPVSAPPAGESPLPPLPPLPPNGPSPPQWPPPATPSSPVAPSPQSPRALSSPSGEDRVAAALAHIEQLRAEEEAEAEASARRRLLGWSSLARVVGIGGGAEKQPQQQQRKQRRVSSGHQSGAEAADASASAAAAVAAAAATEPVSLAPSTTTTSSRWSTLGRFLSFGSPAAAPPAPAESPSPALVAQAAGVETTGRSGSRFGIVAVRE